MTQNKDDKDFDHRENARRDISYIDESTDIRNELLRQRKQNITLRKQLEDESADFRKHFEVREAELNERTEKLRRDFADREKSLEQEFSKRVEQLEKERNALLLQSQKQLNESKNLIREFEVRKVNLSKEQKEFEKEKQRYNEEAKAKLQDTSSHFVGGVITDLRTREKNLMIKSTSWSVYGGVALFFALCVAVYAISSTVNLIENEIPVSNVIFLLIKGTFFMAIAGVIARFSFILSQKYLSESLRVSDIIHGVRFGEMYVKTYGASASWDEVQDAFSQWHNKPQKNQINPLNSTSDYELDTDDIKPEIVDRIIDAVKELKT